MPWRYCCGQVSSLVLPPHSTCQPSIPVVGLDIPNFVAHSLCGMFGVAVGALGMLGTLTMGLTIGAFGPMSDNVGDIAMMSQLDEWV